MNRWSSSFLGSSSMYLLTKSDISLSAIAYSTNALFLAVTKSIPTGGLSSVAIISLL